MRYDTLVVGGGIVGCSTAWHLAQSGLRVAVIEREADVDDPSAATADVARAGREAGVVFHLGVSLAEVATEWHGDGLQVRGVRLVDGTMIEAPTVVNCAGPHSGWLNVVAHSPLPLAT